MGQTAFGLTGEGEVRWVGELEQLKRPCGKLLKGGNLASWPTGEVACGYGRVEEWVPKSAGWTTSRGSRGWRGDGQDGAEMNDRAGTLKWFDARPGRLVGSCRPGRPKRPRRRGSSISPSPPPGCRAHTSPASSSTRNHSPRSRCASRTGRETCLCPPSTLSLARRKLTATQTTRGVISSRTLLPHPLPVCRHRRRRPTCRPLYPRRCRHHRWA
mmetsp:Transcript_5923/g.18219  ORF Transcript_5923/g.18219 Transcript_5923/m.18219 type:complete len:214 (+) Transcript_5923:316-957(+)